MNGCGTFNPKFFFSISFLFHSSDWSKKKKLLMGLCFGWWRNKLFQLTTTYTWQHKTDLGNLFYFFFIDNLLHQIITIALCLCLRRRRRKKKNDHSSPTTTTTTNLKMTIEHFSVHIIIIIMKRNMCSNMKHTPKKSVRNQCLKIVISVKRIYAWNWSRKNVVSGSSSSSIIIDNGDMIMMKKSG